jgi:hypothetical protein
MAEAFSNTVIISEVKDKIRQLLIWHLCTIPNLEGINVAEEISVQQNK